MPTGYTAAIADGITFNQFVMGCARAMGACIMMRDDPSDAEIPEEFQPDDYYSEAVERTRVEIADIQAMTTEEADLQAAADYSNNLTEKETAIKEADELRAKYERMLEQVKAWNPPTPDHIGFKDFMSKQITESIEWDCSKDYYRNQQPVRLSGEDWKATQLETLMSSLVSYEKNLAEEIERTNSRNAWIKALRNSLK